MSESVFETAADPAEFESLSLRVADVLRERIIRGEYPQGARLPEARIASELAVSRVPLRAALPRLEMEGFVRTEPRRGAVVSRWTRKQVHDLFDVRLAIEVAAAGYAATRVAAGSSTAALAAAIADAADAGPSGDAYRIAVATSAVHQRIVELADNDQLTALFGAVHGRVTWLFFLTAGLEPEAAHQEHVALAKAVGSGNEHLARAEAYAHIESSRGPSVDALQGLPDA